MSYTINKFSGEQLIVLADGTIDTTTSINLVGRNYVGYGEAQNENFVWMLEHFANDRPPARPLTGQIWFNTTDNGAYVYDGAAWVPIGTATVSSTAPVSTNTGSLWLDTAANKLSVWNGNTWSFIGPEAVAGFGATRARSVSIDDYLGNPKPVILFETNDSVVAVCTAESFTVHPDFAIPNVSSSLIAGINLANTAKINGDVTGNAGSAFRLYAARNINNVPFDGQNNITVRASTTHPLVKGSYINGSNFDGSAAITWAVDATPSNVIGKVVARDSSGDFSAGNITANLTGNVTGNVTASTGYSSFNEVRANIFVGSTLTGNANSASQLATSRKINGVSFNGTSDITITADALTLTNTALASNVIHSSLQTVGTLDQLTVADPGISIGSSSQMRLLVDAGVPTFRSQVGKINFDMGSAGPDINFVSAENSLLVGGPNNPSLYANNTVNIGLPASPFNKVYAAEFKGNSDTATLAASASNLTGGGTGAIPYQSLTGVTSMLGLGADNYILRARAGGPSWEPLILEQLNKGSYVNMINTATSGDVNYFNSSVPVTISVDATSANTPNKVVARDSSGNFSAGTITANLSGTATNATYVDVRYNPDENETYYVGLVDVWFGNNRVNADWELRYNPSTNTLTTTNFDGTATYARYASTQPQGTSNTTVATTAFVQQEIGASRIRSMVITSGQGSWTTTTPDPQFPFLINAYMPANTVPYGTQFSLIVNISYATTSNSVSGSQWINAYRWGSLSVSATTTLYNSYLGRKLIYYSNGSTWVYTGSWSNV